MASNGIPMFKFVKLLEKCASTAYSEPSSVTHDTIIDQIAPILIEECNLACNSWVVEVGAGNGRLLETLNNASQCAVVAVNIAEENIHECKSRGLFVDESEMHAPGWTYYEPDLYVFRHVLEHSPCPMLVLQMAYDTLKVGGFVYIEVPLPDSVFQHEENVNHYSVLPAAMWRSLSKKVGFEVVRDINIDFSVPQPDGRVLPDRYYALLLRKG